MFVIGINKGHKFLFIDFFACCSFVKIVYQSNVFFGYLYCLGLNLVDHTCLEIYPFLLCFLIYLNIGFKNVSIFLIMLISFE